MEWLWVLALLAILFGPVIWAVTKDRSGGAPSADDSNAGSAVTDSVRQIASSERAPGGSGRAGPLPPPS